MGYNRGHSKDGVHSILRNIDGGEAKIVTTKLDIGVKRLSGFLTTKSPKKKKKTEQRITLLSSLFMVLEINVLVFGFRWWTQTYRTLDSYKSP